MAAQEELRIAAALAHVVPGAALHLTLRQPIHDVAELLVADALGADLHPCRFRAMVVAWRARGDAMTEQIAGIAVAGGVVHLGAGVYERRGPEGRECWFATLLDSDRTIDLLSAMPGDHECDARVLPDTDLEVTVIRLMSTRADVHLDDLAVRVVAACLSEELMSAPLQAPRTAAHHIRQQQGEHP